MVDEADLEVVDDVSRAEVLEYAAHRHDVDVVVIGSDDPELALRLLDLQPQLKVLAVGGEGIDTRLYELRPWRVLLGDVSPGSSSKRSEPQRVPRGRRRPGQAHDAPF